MIGFRVRSTFLVTRGVKDVTRYFWGLFLFFWAFGNISCFGFSSTRHVWFRGEYEFVILSKLVKPDDESGLNRSCGYNVKGSGFPKVRATGRRMVGLSDCTAQG